MTRATRVLTTVYWFAVMSADTATTREPRPERATLMLTRAEKRAVRCVAAARGMTESDLLRAMRLDEIVAEFERLAALVRGEDE